MTRIKKGDRLQSNDPREDGKIVTVTAIYKEPRKDKWYAVYQAGVRKAKVRFDRIHTDGRPRNQGYTLLH